jgi:succinate-semialdehyde dehydrogenase/glutarate-semialdehyde dehydrogenase
MVAHTNVPTDLWIGGAGSAAVSSDRFEVVDPATGDAFETVANATPEDAIAAVTAAHEALGSWRATAPRSRAETLRRCYDLMMERADVAAALIVAENGKALSDAQGEVRYAAEFFRWFSEEAVRVEGSLATSPDGTRRILVVPQPVGVALLVTPWNFPAAMITRKVAPALAAGCTVVIKPAGDTPLTALWLARLLAEAGVPDGVVNVVPSTRSSAVVSAVMQDVRVRKLSFTGSTEVGRLLLAQAAPSIMSCSMELGGNAPFVIFADADLDQAVEGLMVAKTRGGGAACVAANRIYVEADIADVFTERLRDAMGALRLGSGLEPGTEVGPMINEVERGRVESLVHQAAADGASIVVGGHAPDRRGYFYAPTVLDNVADDAAILEQEIFGPVAPVVRFSGEERAIALANATDMGLMAYVYTSDLARGLRFAEALESGMVALNKGMISDPAAPFGGVKQSGLGREGGHEGIREFLETKYIGTGW